MSLGMITTAGRILTARLLLGDRIDGITHCAIGEGDETFTDPQNPPDPNLDQSALIKERARTKFFKKAFLEEDPEGPIQVKGISYREVLTESRIIGLFFRFEEQQANGITIREYGFFGGGVQHMNGVGDLAMNGTFDEVTNPEGQVLEPGYLYEIKNIADAPKTIDTRLTIVCLIKV